MQYLDFSYLWCFHYKQTKNWHENRWMEIALAMKLHDKHYAGGAKKQKQTRKHLRKEEEGNSLQFKGNFL